MPRQTPDSFVLPGSMMEVRTGRPLHVAAQAGGNEPTVFLSHGGGGNKNQWRNQWTALVRAGCSVVAWDNLGHGASPRPRGAAHYTGAQTVADYLAIFERFRTRHNVLVGHSLGSVQTLVVLQQLAARRRLRQVDQAVLLGARLHGAAMPLLRRSVAFLESIRPQLEADFRARAWHHTTDPALIDFEERQARNNSLAVFKALFAEPAVIDEQRLAALKLPIRVIAGNADGLTPAQGARDLAERLPQASVEVLARCGHQIMLEQAQRVNRILLEIARTIGR